MVAAELLCLNTIAGLMLDCYAVRTLRLSTTRECGRTTVLLTPNGHSAAPQPVVAVMRVRTAPVASNYATDGHFHRD